MDSMTQNSVHKQFVKTVYIGTVVRAASVRQGGEILKIDWPSKIITNRRPVVPTDPSTDDDANPRGNSRGCRGIAAVGDQVVYANYHTITIADKDLTISRKYSHPHFAGLHELWVENPDQIVVAATAVDGAHKLNLKTGQVEQSYWPRMNADVRAVLNVESPTIDYGLDQRLACLNRDHAKHRSHLHLNAVSRINGRLIGLINRHGVLLDLESGEIFVRDDLLIGSHNIVPISDTRCIVCDTKRVAILYVDLKAGDVTEIVNLRNYSVVQELEESATLLAERSGLLVKKEDQSIARPLFVRGLAVHAGRVFVGISPATIIEIELSTREMITHMTLTHDPRVCIHGLAVA